MVRTHAAAIALLTALVLLTTGEAVLANGVLVPTDASVRVRGQWSVAHHHVAITVRDQVADVHIDQEFVNHSGRDMEVQFLLPIPPGAAIDSMTLIADGQELPGELMNAEDARRVYESIVRAQQDPALLEYVGQGLYRTRVFPLPAGGRRRVIIHYTTLCPRDGNLVDVTYPLGTDKFSAQPIEQVRVTVDIHAEGPIGPVYSPTHDLRVERPAPQHARAVYEVNNDLPNQDFRVFYQPADQPIHATVLAHRPKEEEPGYFLLLVSPTVISQGETPRTLPKDVVFVLDRSGSMGGQKIVQARQALQWIVRNLGPQDRFNIVLFDDRIERVFSEPLVLADAAHVVRAVDLVGRISARGGTDIHGSLVYALQQFDDSLQPDSGGGQGRPRYVLFLTDGQATTGVTDEVKILAGVAQANRLGARVFSVGVGYDVNVRLVDRLSLDNGGAVAYVKPNESLEGPLGRLYARIQSPVLTDLAVDFGGAEILDMYPRELGDLFEGDQLVVVSRYREPGSGTLTLTGRQVDKEVRYEYAIRLPRRTEDIGNAHVEKLWAVRRVGDLMDQIALHGQSAELIDALIQLSRDYGILTPYTAFLADERTDLADRVELRREAGRNLQVAMERGGAGEAAQRSAQSRMSLREAPRGPMQPAIVVKEDGSVTHGLAMAGNTTRDAYEAGEVEVVTGVRQVGQQTLYRRGRQWFTPDLAELDPQAEAVHTIQQFSDDYFALARANTSQENQLLAAQAPGEELLVRLRGQVYRIVPVATR